MSRASPTRSAAAGGVSAAAHHRLDHDGLGAEADGPRPGVPALDHGARRHARASGRRTSPSASSTTTRTGWWPSAHAGRGAHHLRGPYRELLRVASERPDIVVPVDQVSDSSRIDALRPLGPHAARHAEHPRRRRPAARTGAPHLRPRATRLIPLPFSRGEPAAGFALAARRRSSRPSSAPAARAATWRASIRCRLPPIDLRDRRGLDTLTCDHRHDRHRHHHLAAHRPRHRADAPILDDTGALPPMRGPPRPRRLRPWPRPSSSASRRPATRRPPPCCAAPRAARPRDPVAGRARALRRRRAGDRVARAPARHRRRRAGALREAGVGAEDIDVVAATAGPGLIGALLVGPHLRPRPWPSRSDRPFVAVHHMEAHLFATELEDEPARPPFVGLLVSGGHTMLLWVPGMGALRAAGRDPRRRGGRGVRQGREDPRASAIRAGPAIERAAAPGRPAGVPLPGPCWRRTSCRTTTTTTRSRSAA
jgi:hypothetical protein